jgi:hypothetical protein
MNYKHLEDVPGIERIVPDRYVWHVSSPKKRASILEFGLTPEISDHKCIFANNQSVNIKLMYPFCLHVYKRRYNTKRLLKYDYWRIDTSMLKADWYIDPNMKGSPREAMVADEYFVATETPIPREAIELFEVGQEFIGSKKNILITTIEKSTNNQGYLIMNHVDDNFIKNHMKEIKADLQKTDELIKIKISKFSYVKDVPFPLVKVP